MSGEVGPWFYAWSNDKERIHACATALSALVRPGGLCDLSLSTLGISESLWRRQSPVDEAIALMCSAFTMDSDVRVSCDVQMHSGCLVGISVGCYGERFDARYPHGPLRAAACDTRGVYQERLHVVPRSGLRSVEVEAVILSMQVQDDAEDLLLRFCAPNESKRVTTGCISGHDWVAPIEVGATYNADAVEVARDLALSWVHLHDGDRVGRVAGLSLDELAARVEAAPRGARVGVSVDYERSTEHLRLDYEAAKSRDTRGAHPGAVRRVPRAILPGDAELTREQVLQVLSTPPATLLDALEASAVPDDEWRAAEPWAIEAIEAKKQGASTYEVDITTGKHTRFIQRHAPYHVRRLPNGGVVLATHPYRTLWPLWADALFLLGLMS
jgi:hypothetical protein